MAIEKNSSSSKAELPGDSEVPRLICEYKGSSMLKAQPLVPPVAGAWFVPPSECTPLFPPPSLEAIGVFFEPDMRFVRHRAWNPHGPFGFGRFNKYKNRDCLKRRIAVEFEVQQRVYAYLMNHLGIQGHIPGMEKRSYHLVRGRCMRTQDSRRPDRWLRMNTVGIRETVDEGFALKYGYRADLLR